MNELIFSIKKLQSIGEKHNVIKRILEYSLYILFFGFFFFSLTLDSVYPLNYVNLVITGLFCLALVSYILFYGSIIIDWFVWLLFIFWLSQLLSTAINLFPFFSQTGTLMAFLSIFVYQFLKQRFCSIKLISIILGVSALLFIIAFLIKCFPDVIHPNFANRAGSFFGNQNDVARHLVYSSLFLLICFFLVKQIWIKMIIVFEIIICFYFVMLTGSISNSSIMLLLFLIFPFFCFKKKQKIIYLIVFLTLIIATIIIINLPFANYFKARILNIINTFIGNIDNASYDQSSALRFKAALYGFKLFIYQPLFGGGYSNVYRNYVVMSHNNISEIMADFGLIGIIPYESVLFISLTHQKTNKRTFFLLMLYIIVFQLFLVCFNDKITSIVIAICASNILLKKKIISRSSTFYCVNI